MTYTFWRDFFVCLLFLFGIAMGSTIAKANPALMESTAFCMALVLARCSLPVLLAGIRCIALHHEPDQQPVVCRGSLLAGPDACQVEPCYQCHGCHQPICPAHTLIGPADPFDTYCIRCFDALIWR